MSAPEYVPRPKAEKARVYESPPWKPESWVADRPADLPAGQPLGPRLGAPGPDQGYILKLARRFEGRLPLAPGESEADVLFGCCAVALRRAALYGRAPMIHDLTVALAIFGYLNEHAHPEQVATRKKLFEQVSNLHHYGELRHIVDMIPEATLRLTPDLAKQQAEVDWTSLFRAKSAGVA